MRVFLFCFLAIAGLFLFFEFAGAMHPAMVCPAFARALLRGSSSSDVSALQTYLSSDIAIYPEGLVTGYFGALTERALQRFQTKHGIVSSGSPAETGYGVLGPRTRAKIVEICKVPAEHALSETVPQPLILPPPTPSASVEPSREGFFAPTLPHVKTTKELKSEQVFMDLKGNNSNGPVAVETGSNVTISWQLSNHKWWYCGKGRNWAGSVIPPASGSETVSNITYNKVFKLTCYVDSQAYEDSVVVEVAPKAKTTTPPPPLIPVSAETTSTGLYDGSFGRLTCLARVRPPVVYLDQPPIEAIWEVESSPIERHIYWHETVDGVDRGHIYWGQTNRSLAEPLPARLARVIRYAHVVADSRHAPNVSNPDHPEDVCVTETLEVEVKPSRSSSNSLLKPFASILNAIFPGLIEY